MSETQPNPNTSRVEGELSLDDLSQIAGGTSTDLLNSIADPFGSDASVMIQTDNMQTSHVGAKGSTDPALTGASAMNLTLTFP